MKSEHINELAAALAKAQSQIKGAVKDSANPFFKSSYADLQSVWDAIRGPLASNGLCVIQTTAINAQGGFELITTLAHSSGQWIEGRWPVKGIKQIKIKQGNEVVTVTEESIEPQAIGTALSYFRRYSLAAICGVYQTDDDGETAQVRNQPKAAAPQPAPRPVAEARPPVAPVVKKQWPTEPAVNPDAQQVIAETIDRSLAGATGELGAPFDLVFQKGPFAGRQIQSLSTEEASQYLETIEGELKALNRPASTLRGNGRDVYYALAQYVDIKKGNL